jgi:hypothetical protein
MREWKKLLREASRLIEEVRCKSLYESLEEEAFLDVCSLCMCLVRLSLSVYMLEID